MDANKNSLPEAPDELAGLVEYKVHGMFASREGARVYPDTFMFSARELKDAGLPKRHIRQAVFAYHAQLLERAMGSMEEVSSDEEEEEEAGPDERMEGGGHRRAAIEPEPRPVETAAHVSETAVVDA